MARHRWRRLMPAIKDGRKPHTIRACVLKLPFRCAVSMRPCGRQQRARERALSQLLMGLAGTVAIGDAFSGVSLLPRIRTQMSSMKSSVAGEMSCVAARTPRTRIPRYSRTRSNSSATSAGARSTKSCPANGTAASA